MTDADKKNCLVKLSFKLDAIRTALEMIQLALTAIGCDHVAHGSIDDARANVANAMSEIEKEIGKE